MMPIKYSIKLHSHFNFLNNIFCQNCRCYLLTWWWLNNIVSRPMQILQMLYTLKQLYCINYNISLAHISLALQGSFSTTTWLSLCSKKNKRFDNTSMRRFRYFIMQNCFETYFEENFGKPSSWVICHLSTLTEPGQFRYYH